jgi:translocation and assembly module TamA
MRWILDSRFFHGQATGPVAAIHLKAAKISDSAPYYERFYLGGAKSLRGFAERSLTPLGWGTELLLGSFELRVPLSRRKVFPPKFSAALFVESGAIGAPGQRINKESFQHAAGFGIRFKAPLLGMMRLDFAFPFDGAGVAAHLTMGQTF